MTRLDALAIPFLLTAPVPALGQVANESTGSGGLGWLWWLGVIALVLGVFWLLFSPRAARAGAPPRGASRSGPRG